MTRNIQTNLFDYVNDSTSKLKNKKPRPKNIQSELSEKETNASASAFGWEFQIASSLILSLDKIKDLDKISVEGNTEDIEIYLTNNNPIYVQAKAVQNTPKIQKDSSKIAAALDTLVNTSNITKGKYSELMIIVNFSNPLNLNKSDLNSSWIPRMDQLFEKPFNSLTDDGQKYLKKRLKTAINSLKKHNHKYSSEYFDFKKLTVVTYIFSSNDKESVRYLSIDKKIENFMRNDCSLNNRYLTRVDVIKNTFIKNYLGLAGSKKNYNITKKEIVFKIISCLMNEPSEKFLDSIPDCLNEELDDYKSYILSEQANKIKNIEAILKGYRKYSKTVSEPIDNIKLINFIDDCYQNYKNLFPLDSNHTEEEKNWGTKYIMRKVLDNRIMLNKVKKGAELN